MPEDVDKEVGIKFDTNKVRVDLVPVDALFAVSRVFTFGAGKYGDRNWEAGIRYSRLYGAALRHILAWFNQEETDEESNENHLAHAICCLLMLLQYQEQQITRGLHVGAAEDDRP